MFKEINNRKAILNGREIESYNIMETEEEAINKTLKPKTVVVDMDETLCNVAPVFVKILEANKEIFAPYFKLDEPYTERDVCLREEYYLEKWLIREEVGLENVPEFLMGIFNDIWSRPDFYTYCKPTQYALSLKNLVNNDNICKNLIIVTTVLSDEQIKAKVDFLYDLYGDNEKVIFIPVPVGKSKSEAIMEEKIEWDSFADDKLENIFDMVCYAKGFGKEILIPKMGYNQPNKEFRKLAKNFKLQVFYIGDEYAN